MAPTRSLATLLALAASLAAAAPAMAGAESDRTTFLVSRALDGGFPNGPSRNATMSHDQRINRVMAYESEASNIVAGDTNGMTDVFLVFRKQPWGSSGTPWNVGATQIASTAPGGRPANGRSYGPALDGDSHSKPSCVAFISEASNLVPGDTNGVADAFVRDLSSGRVTRVSVTSSGAQANGASYEVTTDGDCERVAFSSHATNLALTKTKKLAWKTAVTKRPKAGTRQVYVRVLRGTKHDASFKGLTFLASASSKGKPGSGDSFDPYFGRAGKALVFDSNASNLAGKDRNGTSDIFERAFERRFQHLGGGKGVQALAFRTLLVSGTRAGKTGNGASSDPSVTDDGRYVAYETLASDLLPGDGNGVSDIVETDLKARRNVWVSKSAFSGAGNGASHNPVISDAGEFVLFDSDATNLRPSASVRPDSNGVRDVFLWNRPTGNVSLESRDSGTATCRRRRRTRPPARAAITFRSSRPTR